MYPTREEAERLLREAEENNPGPWGAHSRTAAHCAYVIAGRLAEAAKDRGEAAPLDPEKAYVLGMLHDIGRKFGVRQFV